jgi:hypothetical protein
LNHTGWCTGQIFSDFRSWSTIPERPAIEWSLAAFRNRKYQRLATRAKIKDLRTLFAIAMGLSPQRWKRVTESAFPWEAEALEYLRAALPDCDPYYGWTNFSFIADDGTVNEVDALFLDLSMQTQSEEQCSWPLIHTQRNSYRDDEPIPI